MDYNPTPRYFNVVKEPIIGKSCSLVDTLLDCVDQITIGDYVSFGHNCMVLTGYHDKNLRMEERQSSIKHGPITVHDGVWIASGVIIGANVTIGENSVVGAGSVVVRDIPPNELWGGVPAKFIKKL